MKRKEKKKTEMRRERQTSLSQSGKKVCLNFAERDLECLRGGWKVLNSSGGGLVVAAMVEAPPESSGQLATGSWRLNRAEIQTESFLLDLEEGA